MLHPLLSGAVALALAAALFLVGDGPLLPVLALLVLVAVALGRRPGPAEAAFTRRWLFPPTVGWYAGVGVYLLTHALELAGAVGSAVVAAIWLALYVRERRGRAA
jgi:hypothetical protein